jgi:hypothetical protein
MKAVAVGGTGLISSTRHERRRRAMLAILAVDPQPWRDAPRVGKPAAYVDKLLIEGKCR